MVFGNASDSTNRTDAHSQAVSRLANSSSPLAACPTRPDRRDAANRPDQPGDRSARCKGSAETLSGITEDKT